MQNSGLASALALQFFTPEAALPGVVAAVGANITGAVFAALVRRKPLPGESGPGGDAETVGESDSSARREADEVSVPAG